MITYSGPFPSPKCLELSPPHPVCLTLFVCTLPHFLTYSASENSAWWIRGDMQGSESLILLPNSPESLASQPLRWLVRLRIADQLHNSTRGKSWFFKTGTSTLFSSFHWTHQTDLLVQCHLAQIPAGRLALISGVLLIGSSTLNRSLHFPSISSSHIRWTIITSALRMAEMTDIK